MLLSIEEEGGRGGIPAGGGGGGGGIGGVDDLRGFLRCLDIKNEEAELGLRRQGYVDLEHLLLAPPSGMDLQHYGFSGNEVLILQGAVSHVLQQVAGLGGEKMTERSSRRPSMVRSRSNENLFEMDRRETKQRLTKKLTRASSTESLISCESILEEPVQTDAIQVATSAPQGLNLSVSISSSSPASPSPSKTPSKTSKLLPPEERMQKRRSMNFRTLSEKGKELEVVEQQQEVKTIKVDEWFSNITGCSEQEFIKRRGDLIKYNNGNFTITNCQTGEEFMAGEVQYLSFAQFHRICFSDTSGKKKRKVKMGQSLAAPSKKGQPPVQFVEFVVLTRKENDDPDALRFVDVAYVQSLRENRNAVFQVASNFNGIEAQSELVKPDSPQFTEKYYTDRTQGPAASISAGAGAIVRVHAAFYKPTVSPSGWAQTANRQVNFLEDNHLKDHYPTQNGYVVFNGDETKPLKANSAVYQNMLFRTKIYYHKNQRVVTGHRNGTILEICNDKQQVVDQVMCAAVNIFQGRTGAENGRQPNVEDKCRLILDMAYQGTYLGAIANKRKHIFLTLVGGGIFGNKKEWIYDAIHKAHLMWGVKGSSTLERVTLIAFNPRDVTKEFVRNMKSSEVPFSFNHQTGKS